MVSSHPLIQCVLKSPTASRGEVRVGGWVGAGVRGKRKGGLGVYGEGKGVVTWKAGVTREIGKGRKFWDDMGWRRGSIGW